MCVREDILQLVHFCKTTRVNVILHICHVFKDDFEETSIFSCIITVMARNGSSLCINLHRLTLACLFKWESSHVPCFDQRTTIAANWRLLQRKMETLLWNTVARTVVPHIFNSLYAWCFDCMCVSGYRKRDYRTVSDNKDILHCCMHGCGHGRNWVFLCKEWYQESWTMNGHHADRCNLQYKRSAFAFLFNEVCMGYKKSKMGVTSAYIERN